MDSAQASEPGMVRARLEGPSMQSAYTMPGPTGEEEFDDRQYARNEHARDSRSEPAGTRAFSHPATAVSAGSAAAAESVRSTAGAAGSGPGPARSGRSADLTGGGAVRLIPGRDRSVPNNRSGPSVKTGENRNDDFGRHLRLEL